MTITEEVNVRIIGEFVFPYRFYARDGKPITERKYFVCDRHAIDWFKQNYPEEYRIGVEMRRYDD